MPYHCFFLSCLYGSELFSLWISPDHQFLSCLYGSERVHRTKSDSHSFLSCLYGSEPLIKPKGQHAFLSKLPVRQ